MKRYAIILGAVAVLSACSGHAVKENDGSDLLALYREMTRGKSQLDVRTGEPNQFSGSEKICISAQCTAGNNGCQPTDHYNGSPLMAGSDYVAYYGLTQGSDGYARYSPDSQYARDVAAVVADMDRMMESYRRTGLRRELERRGLTPALMFDIDNTLEFSAGPDSDSSGNGPAIAGVVEFAQRWCFKEGVACYFITARPCQPASVPPTVKWLKDNLNLTDEQAQRYTHFSSNSTELSCRLPDSPVVAYKDVIRAALAQQQNVFWLMSVGDQLTDSLGEHSGMKVRIPNQFFHSDIAPNQYAPWGAGQCGSPHTIAPPRDCAATLLDRAIEVSSVEHCSKPAAGGTN